MRDAPAVDGRRIDRPAAPIAVKQPPQRLAPTIRATIAAACLHGLLLELPE